MPMMRLRLRSAECSVFVLCLFVVAGGCTTSRRTVMSNAAAAGKAAAEAPKPLPPAPPGKGEPPAEFTVNLALRQDQAWKSRFISTGEVKRTLAVAGAEPAVRSRAIGLELTATQKVVAVSDNSATIEVVESDAKVLQDGKFVTAPFRRFDPPSTYRFTIDVRTGAVDFSAIEKSYAEWMAGIKAGPAGDILGKTFRVDAYVRQLKELYGRPFARFAGTKIGKERRTSTEKDFFLPFVGPGAAIAPIAVSVSQWTEGFEAAKGARLLNAVRSFESGTVERKEPEEVALAFADFGMAAPASFRGEAEASGQLRSTLDLLSGREIRSNGQVRYRSTTTCEKGVLTEEIAGKLLLEPVE